MLCKVVARSKKKNFLNFNIGYPILVGISTELDSEVLMSKTKPNKTKIDDIEIN